MDWTKVAFIFPGQGSQEVGMGKSVADAYPVAMDTFKEADDILETNFSGLIFDGPLDELNDTYNTQASLFVTSVATLRALQQEMPEAVPAFAAGHSLGEFTALVAAGSISYPEGLRLVRERGRLMKLAGETNPGGMGAFLGLSVEKAQEICEQAGKAADEDLVIANDNCPGQVVISGGANAVEKALELGKEAGAKRALKLALSVAAHSPLMESAAETFKGELAKVEFKAPAFPVYGNVSAAPLNTPDEIVTELESQVVAAVRWTESVQAMIADGARTFVEIGVGEVLSGLVKRIDRSTNRITVKDAQSLQALLQLEVN
ncbi:MAG: ACP S-malonyltransferase [Chloroflexota bacterium]